MSCSVSCAGCNIACSSVVTTSKISPRVYGWGELTGCMRTLADESMSWDKLDVDQVLEAAQACLIPDRMYFVCVGPWRAKDRERVEQLLENFSLL